MGLERRVEGGGGRREGGKGNVCRRRRVPEVGKGTGRVAGRLASVAINQRFGAVGTFGAEHAVRVAQLREECRPGGVIGRLAQCEASALRALVKDEHLALLGRRHQPDRMLVHVAGVARAARRAHREELGGLLVIRRRLDVFRLHPESRLTVVVRGCVARHRARKRAASIRLEGRRVHREHRRRGAAGELGDGDGWRRAQLDHRAIGQAEC